MKRILPLLSGMAMLLSVGTPAGAAGTHYDVFLLAGQSNLDGRALVRDLTGELSRYRTPQATVEINFSAGGLRRPLTQSKGILPLQPGFSGTSTNAPIPNNTKYATFGPEVSFGAAMAEGLPGKRILLIKFSEGGTGIRHDWNPHEQGKLYENFIAYVRATEKTLTDRGDTYEVHGLLWQQGEADAGSKSYQADLTAFIARVRQDLGLPKLTFLIGQAFDDGNRNPLFSAQSAVAAAVPDAALVESKGLETSDKGTHFDAKSQIELGRRYAAKMVEHMHSLPQ